MLRPVALACALALIITFPAAADDWGVKRLRGQVLQLVDGDWQPLKRGAVVPDTRVIRTLKNGFVTFERGEETIELASNTQIQIFDKAGSKPFTTVKQYFGTVAVEAEVKNVQHFAVQTPYLAAVVKGTRFTVTSQDGGASVTVQRGHVEVEDRADGDHVIVAARQSVSLETNVGSLVVAGSGELPVVVDRKGRPVSPEPASDGPGAVSDDTGKGKKPSDNNDSGGAGSDKSGKADKAEKADKHESANSGGSGGSSNSSGSNDSGNGNSDQGNGNSGNGNGGDDGDDGGGKKDKKDKDKD
ncbi:MAG: FecR family protein [Devosia sp.]